MVSIHSSLLCCDFSNNSSRARVLTPLWSGGPVIVKVFLEEEISGTGGRRVPAPCLTIGEDTDVVSIQDTSNKI